MGLLSSTGRGHPVTVGPGTASMSRTGTWSIGGGLVPCSGNGRCLTMRALAGLAVDAQGNAEPVRYGGAPPLLGASAGPEWDADVIRGCACDEGWEGPDCALRTCPWGSDPRLREGGGKHYAPKQLPEVQTIQCQVSGGMAAGGAAAGTFRLSFRGSISGAIRTDASRDVMQAAVDEIETRTRTETGRLGHLRSGGISVEFRAPPDLGGGGGAGGPTLPSPPVEACGIGDGTVLELTFWGLHGDVPAVEVLIDSGSIDTGVIPLVLVMPLFATEQRAGSTISLECSGRGVCDRRAGECRCFVGYGPSDGRTGGPGTVADCGHRRARLGDAGASAWEELGGLSVLRRFEVHRD